MVWLLDKPFRFVTAYSLDECAALLSRLGADLDSNEGSEQTIYFKMKRIAGRGLVVKVKGTFQDKNTPDGILVSGYGRVSLRTVIFLTYYLIMSMFLLSPSERFPFSRFLLDWAPWCHCILDILV
jgi:hypothetical protein